MYNILFQPGTVVSPKNSSQQYLVLTAPILVKNKHQLVSVAPISEDIECSGGKHLMVPLHKNTDGIICAHKQHTFNCDKLRFIKRLNKNIAEFIVNA